MWSLRLIIIYHVWCVFISFHHYQAIDVEFPEDDEPPTFEDVQDGLHQILLKERSRWDLDNRELLLVVFLKSFSLTEFHELKKSSLFCIGLLRFFFFFFFLEGLSRL